MLIVIGIFPIWKTSVTANPGQTLERLSYSSSVLSPLHRLLVFRSLPLHRRPMLGRGLCLRRSLATPQSLFLSSRCSTRSSRSLLHIAAPTRLSSCRNSSRILQLINLPKQKCTRFASTTGSFPSVHSIASVTKAEVEADADPDNVDAQVKLFRLLIESERPAGWRVLTSRWERMCEFVSVSIHPECSSC